MTTHVERAKILQDFLRANNNPQMEIGLIMGAMMDSAAEAAENAVRTTREACVSLAEKRANEATGVARDCFLRIASEIRMLGK